MDPKKPTAADIIKLQQEAKAKQDEQQRHTERQEAEGRKRATEQEVEAVRTKWGAFVKKAAQSPGYNFCVVARYATGFGANSARVGHYLSPIIKEIEEAGFTIIETGDRGTKEGNASLSLPGGRQIQGYCPPDSELPMVHDWNLSMGYSMLLIAAWGI